ncbi:MAG: hypothetical protein NTY19_24515 [Planctomycetota bacterium]|nr:hypothetical protein [Planctomycetota bacterium]
MVAGNGQGIIIWALGGWDPRGAMYRPDFDILPPAVEQNIPQMRQAFEDSNVRMGVCTRPGEIAFRGTWTQDWTVRINPDDPQHLEIMWGQFKKISQYLLPGAQAAAVSRVDEKKLPAGFERPSHFLMRQHVAPFIPDYLIKGQAKELKEITDEFLAANGQWKK